jgi:hypothetical protein
MAHKGSLVDRAPSLPVEVVTSLSPQTPASAQDAPVNTEEVRTLFARLDDLCSIHNVFLLGVPLRQIASLFQQDFRLLDFSISNLVEAPTVLYLIGIFGQTDLPDDVRWPLISLFANLAFYSRLFTDEFVKNPSSVSYLLAIEIPTSPAEVKLLSTFFYNTCAAVPLMYSMGFITRWISRFLCSKDDQIRSEISFSLINLFRFGDVDDAEFSDIFVDFFRKCCRRPLPARVQEHLLWCIYFWLSRSTMFLDALFYQEIFVFLCHRAIGEDSNLSAIALSCLSYATFSYTDDHIALLYSETPLSEFSKLFQLADTSAERAMLFCANFAAIGTDFVEALANTSAVLEAVLAFQDGSYSVKAAVGNLFIEMICHGATEQLCLFTTLGTMAVLNELLTMEDSELVSDVIQAFLVIGREYPNIAERIDMEGLEIVALEHESEECRAQAAGLLEM